MRTQHTMTLHEVITGRLNPGATLYIRVSDGIYKENPPMTIYHDYHAALNPSGGYMLELHRFANSSKARWRMYNGTKHSAWYPMETLYNLTIGLCFTE